MRAKIGILRTFQAIAVGVTLSGGQMATVAQDVSTDPIDLAVLCQDILLTRTIAEFEALPIAINSLNDPESPCYSVAYTQWLLLQDDTATGALQAGYQFQ